MFNLTPSEQQFFYPLAILLLAIPVFNYLKKDPASFWSPLTIISLVFLYYTVLGPIMAIRNNQTIYRLIDHREFYQAGWQAALLAFVSLLIGFKIIPVKFNRMSIPLVSDDKLNTYGKNLYKAGFIMFALIAGYSGLGAQINFLDNQWVPQTGYQGAFQNYLAYGINFFIPGVVILMISFLNKKTNLIWLVGLTLLAIAIYLNAGFRYRLVLLGYAVLSAFYLYRLQKPNPVLLSGILVLGITVMGFIVTTRNYGTGLIIDEEQILTQEEYFYRGFEESSVFATTSLLINEIPEKISFTGSQFLYETIALPIPRVLWPDKPSGESLNIILEIYGGGLLGTGAAVLNFGEHYAAYGWWGIIIFNLLLGLLLKILWSWFLQNRNNALAIAYYACANAYLYVVISRGYLPQVVFLFFYTAFPAYVIIWWHRRKYRFQSLTPRRPPAQAFSDANSPVDQNIHSSQNS